MPSLPFSSSDPWVCTFEDGKVTSGVSTSGEGTGSRSTDRLGWISGRLGSVEFSGTVAVRAPELDCGGVTCAATNGTGSSTIALAQKLVHRDGLANIRFNPGIARLSDLRNRMLVVRCAPRRSRPLCSGRSKAKFEDRIYLTFAISTPGVIWPKRLRSSCVAKRSPCISIRTSTESPLARRMVCRRWFPGQRNHPDLLRERVTDSG